MNVLEGYELCFSFELNTFNGLSFKGYFTFLDKPTDVGYS